jgi:hypothetical protein
MLVKSFLSPGQIFPTKGRVLLEAVRPERRFGPEGEALFLPEVGRYPTVGRVYRGGEEEGLKVGDLVVLQDEGQEMPHTYYDVFKIVVGDFQGQTEIIADNEIEPLFRERVEAFRANPSTEDKRLSVKDVATGEQWSFLCSDVLTYGYEDLTTPTYRLEYIPTFMIDLYHEGKFRLFYIAHLSNILMVIGE